MKNIFKKTVFPQAPGGDRYEWKEAETIFEVPSKGRYMIAMQASAKNGQQNGTGDDDDLRVMLDDYPLGAYEIHEEMVPWKGFGTSASWDGTSLKGATKTIYFFVEFEKGKHRFVFFADGMPELKGIEVFALKKDEEFLLENRRPSEAITTDRKGIPWMSFVFLRVHPKALGLVVKCQSGKQKNGTDGDNLKVVVNGKILINPQAPISNTYKNFYFSGDQMQGQSKTLELGPEDFDWTENALGLWYDETPILEKLQIGFFAHEADYLEKLEKEFIKNPEAARRKAYASLQLLAFGGKISGLKYSSKLLLHSLQKNPPEIIFESNDPIVREIKKDKMAYNKILSLVKREIKSGNLKGEIEIKRKKDEINFEKKNNRDLYYAIHGIKTIRYEASFKREGQFDVNITLLDRYDFDPTGFLTKMGDKAEKIRVIQNYPIRIKLKENLRLK